MVELMWWWSAQVIEGSWGMAEAEAKASGLPSQLAEHQTGIQGPAEDLNRNSVSSWNLTSPALSTPPPGSED